MIIDDFESGLNINIEAEFVIKFDQHKFFLPYSGQGFKGVDYMIVNSDYLYLIEIKNFSQYEDTPIVDKVELNNTFLEKCDDSLAIIEKFYTYLESGFWTRIFILKLKWFFTGPREWKHWIKAYEHFQSKQVIMLMHVEY
jgi:hypothetical protein